MSIRKIEIEINHHTMDTMDEDLHNLVLNYSAAVVSKPWDAYSLISFYIKLPDSANNRKALNFGESDTLNNTIKDEKICRIKVDGLLVFDGIGIINAYMSAPLGKASYYSLQLRSVNLKWWSQLKYRRNSIQALYLNELMPSESVSYTGLNMYYTWIKTGGTGCWPVVNYGKWKNNTYISVEDIRPAFYWKTFLNSCFNYAGYQLDANSMSGISYWDDLVCPFFGNNFKRTSSFCNAYKVINVNNSLFVADTGGASINLDGVLSDLHHQWDSGSHKFVAGTSGIYGIVFTMNGNAIASLSNNSNLIFISILVNGLPVKTINQTLFYSNAGFPFSCNISHTLNLQENDEVEFFIKTAGLGNTFESYDGESIVIITLSDEIVQGQTFDTKEVWDNTIPVQELLKDLMLIFNLRVQVDELNKIIYIDTRDKFLLKRSEAANLSDQLDLNYEIEQNNYLQDYGKHVQFNYAKDQNAYINKYEEDQHLIYASDTRFLNNGFIEESTLIVCSHICATPMMYDPKITLQPGTYNLTALLPTLWNKVQEIDGTRPPFSTDCGPRILVMHNHFGLDSPFGIMNFADAPNAAPGPYGISTAYTFMPDAGNNINLHFGNIPIYPDW